MVVAIFLKETFCLLDRTGEVSALAWDEVGIERVQGFTERIVVQSQWAKGEGASGERDESHSVALEPCDKVDDAKSSAFQAVGREVIRQHATRRVHGEEDVDSLALHFSPFVAHLRSCDCAEGHEHGE